MNLKEQYNLSKNCYKWCDYFLMITDNEKIGFSNEEIKLFKKIKWEMDFYLKISADGKLANEEEQNILLDYSDDIFLIWYNKLNKENKEWVKKVKGYYIAAEKSFYSYKEKLGSKIYNSLFYKDYSLLKQYIESDYNEKFFQNHTGRYARIFIDFEKSIR